MQKFEFHPFSDDYPLMPMPEIARMTERMERDGYDPRFPIVLFCGKILDGRNRYIACVDADVLPLLVEFPGTEDEAREFVQTANEERRHLAAEWLAARRAERVERVAASRVDGKSLRTIAEEEGVSQSQVRRDIEESLDLGAPPGAPESRENRWNGRKDLPGPEAAVLCDRCQRVGARADCPACAEARKAKPKPKKKVPAARGDIKDKTGAVVPNHCRDAFADPSLPELIAELEQVEAMFNTHAWLSRAGKLTDHYGFILIEKFNSHAFESLSELQLAIEALKAGVPYAVCPKCKAVDSSKDGHCCRGCRGYGHVPETRFQELSK